MPIIKNIGKQDRMVADRILHPGDAKYISQKQAEQFDGIPDFEIVDETPKAKAEGGMQKDEVTLQAKPEVAPEPGQDNPAPTLPAKARKSRGKKK